MINIFHNLCFLYSYIYAKCARFLPGRTCFITSLHVLSPAAKNLATRQGFPSWSCDIWRQSYSREFRYTPFTLLILTHDISTYTSPMVNSRRLTKIQQYACLNEVRKNTCFLSLSSRYLRQNLEKSLFLEEHMIWRQAKTSSYDKAHAQLEYLSNCQNIRVTQSTPYVIDNIETAYYIHMLHKKATTVDFLKNNYVL